MDAYAREQTQLNKIRIFYPRRMQDNKQPYGILKWDYKLY